MSVRDNLERLRLQRIYSSNCTVTMDNNIDWDLSDDMLELAFRDERVADLMYRAAEGPPLHRKRWVEELVQTTRAWKEGL